VRNHVEQKIRAKEKLMGFGHRVYKVKDPRAIILQKVCERLFKETGTSALYEVALEVEKVASELMGAKGIYPNVDFYSGMVYDKMGIELEFFTPMFAMARVAGWLAHWFEQLKENKLYRPEQIYAGDHNRPYVPIEER
jgi:citrate synthase